MISLYPLLRLSCRIVAHLPPYLYSLEDYENMFVNIAWFAQTRLPFTGRLRRLAVVYMVGRCRAIKTPNYTHGPNDVHVHLVFFSLGRIKQNPTSEVFVIQHSPALLQLQHSES